MQFPILVGLHFVPSIQLRSLFKFTVFLDKVMFPVLLHSAFALVTNVVFSVVCRYHDSHTDVTFFFFLLLTALARIR